MKMIKQIILKMYRLHKNEVLFFVGSLAFYFFWRLVPYILPQIHDSVLAIAVKIKTEITAVANFFYELIDSLIASLVTGIFFHLIFTAWNEQCQTKNELKYCIYSYEQMKKRVLEIMILAENKSVKPKNFDETVNKIYNNPQQAQKYFSQNRFRKTIDALDKETLKEVIAELRKFLKEIDKISYDFIKDEDLSLRGVFEAVNDMKSQMIGFKDYVFIDWQEAAILKSGHPLYLLFCQEEDQEDPRFKTMNEVLKKYN